MTKVDDLSPKDWIAITAAHIPEEPGYDGMAFFMPRGRRPMRMTGAPLFVVAINLPFICVKDGSDKVFAIDVRVCEFQRLDAKYVGAMVGRELEKPKSKKRRKAEAELERQFCPRCKQRMVERLHVPKKPPTTGTEISHDMKLPTLWYYFCKNCGWGGDPVLTNGG